jgi:4-amino-4-deoxy-L-arabinose transferase-like glycosyltransferase
LLETGRHSKKIVIGLLALMLTYHILTNLWYIGLDKRPCNINELSHVIGAVEFLNIATDQGELYSAYLQGFSGYPPAGVIASIGYAVLGRTHDSAQISQLFFSIMLVIGIFGVARKLFDEKTALLAVFFCLTAPASCEVSRQYLLEWSLTATSCTAAWLLLESEGFSNRKYAFFAALFIGFAALCKQTFLIFLAGPILYSIGQWVVQIKKGTRAAPNKRALWKTALGILATFAASVFVAWAIYSPGHRFAIDNWINISAKVQYPWGMIFFYITASLLCLSLGLLWLRSTPLRNGLMAGMFSIFVASLWYFPKGVMNFMTYYNQMQLNVEKSSMTPASLLNFYYQHLRTYYLGPAVLYILCAAIALWVLIFLLKPYLRRNFFLPGMMPPKASLFYILLWLLIPAVAFFFINIQNEMNTVPLLPPLFIFAAALLGRLQLPYAKKAQRMIKQGHRPAAAWLQRAIVTVIATTLLVLLVGNGFLLSWIFHDGEKFSALPAPFSELAAKKYMPRKFIDINYLVPRPKSWHETQITRTMGAQFPEIVPRILIMDVDFNFSWNTFWYYFKLERQKAEIETQWYDDRDLLTKDNGQPGLFGYDMIL